MIPQLLDQCHGDGFCRLGIYLGCAAVVIVFWLGCLLVMASLGGWKRLAETYGIKEGYPMPEGERLKWVSASLKKRLAINYNNVLTLTFAPEGLGMMPARIFGTGHAPLLFPWNDLRLTEKDRLFAKVLEVRIAETGYAFFFWGKSAKAIMAAYAKFQRV